MYISLPVFVMLCVFPREILIYVFDGRYADGWLPLIILSVGQLVSVGGGAIGPLLVMTGHQKRWSILSGVALGINICLNWYLVPKYGLTGAAASTAVSLCGLSLFGVMQIWGILKMRPYDRRYLKGLAGAGLAIIGLLAYRFFFPIHSLPGVVIATLIAGIIFLAAVIALGLDREDRDFARLSLARWNRMRE